MCLDPVADRLVLRAVLGLVLALREGLVIVPAVGHHPVGGDQVAGVGLIRFLIQVKFQDPVSSLAIGVVGKSQAGDLDHLERHRVL